MKLSITPLMAALSLIMSALAVGQTTLPVTKIYALPFTVTAPVAVDWFPFTKSVPPVTEVVPVKVLLPESTNVLDPDFVTLVVRAPPPLLIMPLNVTTPVPFPANANVAGALDPLPPPLLVIVLEIVSALDELWVMVPLALVPKGVIESWFPPM